MAYNHFYDYTCTESSETRGSRVTKTTACGWSSVRATKEEISESFKPQARPCDRCTRRMRLNKGNTTKAPDLMVKKMIRSATNPYDRTLYSVDSDVPDMKARKQWAHDRADARNRFRFGIDSNTSEQVDETIEQVPKTIEQVVKTIEHNGESFEDIGGVLIDN
jgi:hypothetical protein